MDKNLTVYPISSGDILNIFATDDFSDVTIKDMAGNVVLSAANLPDSGGQTINYHRNQALIAIGSGELLGMGFGKSVAKMNYLPEVVGDSIFAVLAQEFGFVGAGFVVVLFLILIIRLLLIAKNTRDKFGRFILIGFAAIIASQAFVNMGSISGILPLTGVPLPFMSYGGTALAVFITMGGIAVNISKYSG